VSWRRYPEVDLPAQVCISFLLVWEPKLRVLFLNWASPLSDGGRDPTEYGLCNGSPAAAVNNFFALKAALKAS